MYSTSIMCWNNHPDSPSAPLGDFLIYEKSGHGGPGSDEHDELLLSHSLVNIGDGFVNVDVCDVTYLDRPEAFMSKIGAGRVRFPG